MRLPSLRAGESDGSCPHRYCRRLNMNESKKAREKIWLKKLQVKAGLEFEVIEERESPDFLIQFQSHIVGVEVATLQLDQNRRGPLKGSVLQEKYVFQQQIVHQARKLYFCGRNKPINANIFFMPSGRESLQSVGRRELAQSIVETLRRIKLEPWEQRLLDQDSAPAVPSPVEFIYVRGLPEDIRPHDWQVVAPGWSRSFSLVTLNHSWTKRTV